MEQIILSSELEGFLPTTRYIVFYIPNSLRRHVVVCTLKRTEWHAIVMDHELPVHSKYRSYYSLFSPAYEQASLSKQIVQSRLVSHPVLEHKPPWQKSLRAPPYRLRTILY